jgi:hypothetical protein
VYWHYGVCYYNPQAQLAVRFRTELPDIALGETAGAIIIEIEAGDKESIAIKLAQELSEAIQNIPIGEQPEVSSSHSVDKLAREQTRIDIDPSMDRQPDKDPFNLVKQVSGLYTPMHLQRYMFLMLGKPTARKWLMRLNGNCPIPYT